MANTLVLKDLLSPKIIESLRNPVRAKAYCDVEGDFTKGMGDTIAFVIFPEDEAQVGGVAGSQQNPRDLVLGETSMTLDKRVHDSVRLTNWEKYIQNFDLQAKIVAEYVRQLERKQEDYIFNTIISEAGHSINNSGSPATESSSTIYASILQFKEILDDAGSNTDGEGEIVVFINDAVNKVLKQADIFDATEAGLRARQMGAIGSLLDGNIHVVSTSRMPRVDTDASGVADETYILGMRRGAVKFGNGIYNLAIREAPDAFAANVFYESIFGVDVLGTPNKKKIVKKHVANMTQTTPFTPVI